MRKDLTEGTILRNIIHTGYPMVIALAVETCYNVVDSIYVGRLSANALGAVAMAFPIMMILFAIAGCVGVGANSVMARLIGQKEREKAKAVAAHAVLLGAAISIIVSAAGYYLAKPMLLMMGAGELLELSWQYTSVIFLGSLFLIMFTIINNIFRADGDSKTPMKAMLIATGFNIIMDPVFIFLLGLGVRGAAIATVLADMTGTAIMLWMLYKRSSLAPDFTKFKASMRTVAEIFKTGVPGALSQLGMSLGMLLLIKVVSHFGADGITALGIGLRLDSVAILPALGLMMGITAVAGQNYGAKKHERVEETAYKGAVIAGIITGTVGLAYMIAPSLFVSMFSSEPGVMGLSAMYLKIVSLTYIFAGFGIAINGVFIGTGHATRALILTILRAIILSPVLAYALAITLDWGIAGAWWAICISTLVSGSASLIWFRLRAPA